MCENKYLHSNYLVAISGGSRGGSQGAMDPPFQAEHCMQKQDSHQLTEVQQSLPASTPVLSVQSSYKQSLENLNLQAWCMQQLASWSKCTTTAQRVGVTRIFRALRAHFLVCGSSLLEVLDPPLAILMSMNWLAVYCTEKASKVGWGYYTKSGQTYLPY